MTSLPRAALLAASLLLTAAAPQPLLAQGAAAPPPAGPPAQPKTPLPPRDAPKAQQTNYSKAAPQDPDWPCVQRKVATLSYGQMWAGPPLDDAIKNWENDKAVAELVPTLVARRTSMDDARAAIETFAKNAGDKKNDKLVLLFAGVFDELNSERSHVVDGIERFARKQRELSEKIKTESLKMAQDQKDMAAQMSPEGQQAQQALDWDTRIYDERSQSLTYVCETPTILEQRAFDLGREIQNQLN